MTILPNTTMEKLKEARFGLILLFIPFLSASTLMWPHHEEYYAIGDIAPVEELGVDGNVHFTYVYSGVTENLWDKFWIWTEIDGQLEFYPLEYYTYEEYKESGEMMAEFKFETVENAVENASDSSNYGTANELNQKVQEIIYQSGSYIGDSFGLMLAIGLVEEWENVDFSKRGKYIIAGTGTMAADNTVGSVGAIRHKLLTAEENDVDIFFVPKDADYYYDSTYSNEYEAAKVVKEEDLNVTVVPVATLDEALSYLRNLD